LAECAARADVIDDLMEWDYGNFEGLTLAQIHQSHPGWHLFRDGCPGGESVQQVAARADRVIERIRALHADVLVFSHGHFIRALALRWCSMEMALGGKFLLQTATLSSLGYDREITQPVIRYWNAASPAE
jgi:probable phosphoglycerate mutase